MRKASTGIIRLDRIWQVTAICCQQLATLPEDDRAKVVASINAFWQCLPVASPISADVEDDPSQTSLFEEGLIAGAIP